MSSFEKDRYISIKEIGGPICDIKVLNSLQDKNFLDFYKNFSEIVNVKNTDVTRENANMNSNTPSGMMMKIASESSKEYTDKYLIKNKKVLECLKNNLLHIHDKDYYPTRSLTCIHYPLDKMLKNGFNVSYSANRPSKRIESASLLTCIIFEVTQNEMHGGQSVPAFDFYLAPYVRMAYEEEIKKIEKFLHRDLSELRDLKIKDYLREDIKEMDINDLDCIRKFIVNETVRRVHQAMESFIHNMNTIHSRGGNQVVFSSINYGTDTSAEGRCIMRELLNATDEGVGNGSTAIFPIQIWKKKKGVNFNPEDPNYDLYQLACKVTARRFYPNFINLDASFNYDEKWDANDPERYIHEVATMGCRTRVYDDRFGIRTSVGRGNLSFTSVNIVKIALQCRDINDTEERVKMFFSKLNDVMEIAAEQLEERYEFQSHAKKKQFPTLMGYLWMDGEKLGDNDEIKDVMKHGTLSIGYIGLAECLIALIGKHHGESDEAQQLGLRIISFMQSKTKEFSERYNKNYAVIATPAEGLSGKFVRKDREEFGIIKGVTDKDYYTNSNHVPVYYHCSPRHKAKIEGPYHELTLAGNIFYVELDGDVSHNVKAVDDVVKLMDEYNIGYCAINHNRNHCLNCLYEDSQKDLKVCPSCGSTRIDTIQRITGYLVGTIDRWNDAKKAELKDRVVHTEN